MTMKKKQKAPVILILIMAVVALALTTLPALSGIGVSASGAEVRKALDYLRGRQNSDGGFAEPDRSSSEQLTAWAIVAIKSAGEEPASWRKSGKSPLDYLSAKAGGWSKLTDVERGCLAVASVGADPRSFGGRDLVGEIKARMAPDGHIGDMINEHCWGLIALKAAGEAVPESSRTWLCARQNVDGGFGFSDDTASDPDDTGAALQALMAAGESRESSTVDRALKYLKFCQASDGGFCWHSAVSNVASTAWAVQGIAATGQDPGSDSWKKGGKTPLDYLASMQQADGHIRYMEDSDSQPTWMTAEAIPALLKRPYPLNFNPAPPSKIETPAQDTDGDPAATRDQPPQPESTVTDDRPETTTSGEPQEAPRGETTSSEEGNTTGTQSGTELTMKSNGNTNPSIKSGQRVLARGGSGLLAFLIVCGAYLVLLSASYFGLNHLLR